MNNVSSNVNDDLNLFDLFSILYKGKWLIIIFVLVSLFSCFIYYSSKDHAYESKLKYEIINAPPFLDKKVIFNDLKSYFFSKTMFEKWKNNYNKKTFLKYEDFVNTKSLNGFIFQKKETDLIVSFSYKKISGFMIIKSQNLNLINNFFDYLSFINKTLTLEYISKVEDELSITKNFIKEFSSNGFNNQTQINSLQNLMILNNYLSKAKKGSSVLTIQHPTIPKRISPPSLSLLFSIFFVFGIIAGSFLALILESFRKYKHEKNKI